jgi:hypothetical protein
MLMAKSPAEFLGTTSNDLPWREIKEVFTNGKINMRNSHKNITLDETAKGMTVAISFMQTDLLLMI